MPARPASAAGPCSTDGRPASPRTASSPSTSRARAGSSTTPPRSGRPCGRRWATSSSGSARRRGGDRDHQPARDGRRLGPLDRAAVRPGDRLAGPPHGGPLRRAGRAGRPRPRAPAHRARARPVLQRHQVRVAAAARAACPSTDDLALGTIDAWVIWNLTGGEVLRHRPDERQPHDAVRHRRGWRGTTSCASCCTSRSSALPEVRRVERAVRRHVATGAACPPASRSAASPATSRRRCSARRASRPGMAKNTYGTGSFVLLNVGADVPAAGRGHADDRGLDARRRHRRLRPRGRDLRHRRRRSSGCATGSASSTTRPRSGRSRRRVDRHRRRLRRAGVHRARQPVVGSVRPRHDRRHHPRHDPGPPRPGRRRVDGATRPATPSRRWCAASGRPLRRAAGRRWRVGDGPAAADPGRSARRPRASGRPTRRRRRSARRTSPGWPRACGRRSTPSAPQWQLDATFAPGRRPDGRRRRPRRRGCGPSSEPAAWATPESATSNASAIAAEQADACCARGSCTGAAAPDRRRPTIVGAGQPRPTPRRRAAPLRLGGVEVLGCPSRNATEPARRRARSPTAMRSARRRASGDRPVGVDGDDAGRRHSTAQPRRRRRRRRAGGERRGIAVAGSGRSASTGRMSSTATPSTAPISVASRSTDADVGQRRRRARRSTRPPPRSRMSMPSTSPCTAPMRLATWPSAPGRSGSQTRTTQRARGRRGVPSLIGRYRNDACARGVSAV